MLIKETSNHFYIYLAELIRHQQTLTGRLLRACLLDRRQVFRCTDPEGCCRTKLEQPQLLPDPETAG